MPMFDADRYDFNNVRELTDEDRAALKPVRPKPKPDMVDKAFRAMDQLVDLTADHNVENGQVTGALVVRASWQVMIDALQHIQWGFIQSLDEVETLKDRIKLLEEEIANR